MEHNISEHMWFEDAEQTGGAFLKFSDELCDVLGIEEGDTCDVQFVERNGNVEVDIAPDVEGLSDGQLEQLAEITDSHVGVQDTLS